MRLAARLTVAALIAAPLAVASGDNTVSVAGSYTSNWDAVSLVQFGDRINGTYVCCGGGTIEGRIIEGRFIRYRWKQPSGWGSGVWTIEPGGLQGTWGPDQDEKSGGRWDLVRKPAQKTAQ